MEATTTTILPNTLQNGFNFTEEVILTRVVTATTVLGTAEALPKGPIVDAFYSPIIYIHFLLWECMLRWQSFACIAFAVRALCSLQRSARSRLEGKYISYSLPVTSRWEYAS
jgi:hypothetical protein